MDVICRSCLSMSEDIKYFKLESSSIAEYFALFVGHSKTSDEELPLWFCWKCFYFIRKIARFRKLCIESTVIFEKYLKKHQSNTLLDKNIIESEKQNFQIPFELNTSQTIVIEYLIDQVNSEINSTDVNTNQKETEILSEEVYSETEINCDSMIEKSISEKLSSNHAKINKIRPKKKILNKNCSKERLKVIKSSSKQKKSIFNTPSKYFNLSLTIVTTLSKEEQIEKLKMLRNSSEYIKAPYKCEKCAKGFVHDIVYRKHKEKHDTVSGQYICDLCTLHFSSKRNLSNHMDTHINQYTCKLCHRTLISKQSIMFHMYTEHNTSEQPIKCDLCKKIYKNRFTYTKHMRIHNNSKEYKCHLCHKVFLWKHNLNRHLSCHKKEKPFSCNNCSKSFFLKENLKNHQTVHLITKRFYCVECDLSYATQAKLNQHLKRGIRHIQPEQLTFLCKFCDKRFSSNSHLSMHIDRVHLNKRSQACTLCEAAFVSKKTLQTHIKSVHEGYRKPRDHVCEVCGKGFSDKRVLQAHLRTHTGEKPYVCKYCGVEFGHSGALYTHVKLVHLKLKRNSSKKSQIGKLIGNTVEDKDVKKDDK